MKQRTVAWLVAATLGPIASVAAPQAHEHGAVKVAVAIDGGLLTISVEAPLDSVLGFERGPRSPDERRAADAVLARWRSGAGLFGADAAARCTLSKAEVHAPAIEPGARPAGRDDHADLDARFEYQCVQPQHLRTLELGLFEAFKRIQRIDVQVAGPTGQAGLTLKRPARSVRLVR